MESIDTGFDLDRLRRPDADRQPPKVSQVDEHGLVATHVACAGCGYDLHSLVAAARCPECNLSIDVTLRATNDAAWLANVKSGIQSMLVGHYLVVASCFCWILAPLGLCFALLLQVGSAIDLAVRHPDHVTSPARNRWLMLFIMLGVSLYLTGIIMMAASSALGLSLVALAGLLHATGIAIAWSRVQTIMSRGISLRLAAAARLLKYLTAAAAAVLAALAACLAITCAAPIGFSKPMLLVLVASVLAWLVPSLIVLHLSGRATRRLLTAATPVDLPSLVAVLQSGKAE